MKISDIIKKDRIFLGLKTGSKRQLLQELAQKAAQVTGLSDRTILTLFGNVKTWDLPVLAAERLCRMPVLKT